jgi:lipopolysaccharide export system protein LptA
MLKNTAWLLMLSAAFSQPSNPGNTIRIISDTMECDQQKNICIATGNAFAERPHDPDNRTIRAEKFIALFEKNNQEAQLKKGETNTNDLSKIEAHGKVVITDKDTIILCDTAIYDHPTQTMELFGNVKITNDENQLNGTYGHADLKTKKYRVTNKESHVEGLFVNANKKAKK